MSQPSSPFSSGNYSHFNFLLPDFLSTRLALDWHTRWGFPLLRCTGNIFFLLICFFLSAVSLLNTLFVEVLLVVSFLIGFLFKKRKRCRYSLNFKRVISVHFFLKELSCTLFLTFLSFPRSESFHLYLYMYIVY